MAIPLPVIDGIFNLGTELVKRLFPDPTEQAKAQLVLLDMQQKGELELLKTQLSAILAEAQSADPWTSRARPSFMYVIYLLLLFGIPMGFVSAFNPDLAANVSAGFKAWLAAIPSELYTLFGVGYVGYAAARTVDKIKGVQS
jgi:hypothetical protein